MVGNGSFEDGTGAHAVLLHFWRGNRSAISGHLNWVIRSMDSFSAKFPADCDVFVGGCGGNVPRYMRSLASLLGGV